MLCSYLKLYLLSLILKPASSSFISAFHMISLEKYGDKMVMNRFPHLPKDPPQDLWSTQSSKHLTVVCKANLQFSQYSLAFPKSFSSYIVSGSPLSPKTWLSFWTALACKVPIFCWKFSNNLLVIEIKDMVLWMALSLISLFFGSGNIQDLEGFTLFKMLRDFTDQK